MEANLREADLQNTDVNDANLTAADLTAANFSIPDFTRWKDHDSFERAFARFLKDLQATETPPVPRAVEAPNAVAAPKVSATSTGSGAKAGAQELQSIIAIKKRRLRLLEEQQARKGHAIEPHVLMEIEDLRREIGEIEP